MSMRPHANAKRVLGSRLQQATQEAGPIWAGPIMHGSSQGPACAEVAAAKGVESWSRRYYMRQSKRRVAILCGLVYRTQLLIRLGPFAQLRLRSRRLLLLDC